MKNKRPLRDGRGNRATTARVPQSFSAKKAEQPPVGGGAAPLAALVYLLLVGLMWGVFNPSSGMSYETTYVYASENSCFFNGLLYRSDPLRPYMASFYHLSYLISQGLGITGSYLPFQVMYAALWWARGFLVFLIVRKFLPRHPLISYAAGALAVVHACDGALLWVGQMHQFGFIFWMLLAFYLALAAMDAGGPIRTAALVVAACVCEHLSLWTYESQIFLLMIFPAALWARRRTLLRFALIGGAWWLVQLSYGWRMYLKYAAASGQSYQESVLRKGWSLGSLLGDWWFNIAASLKFWAWSEGEWKIPKSHAAVFAVLAAGVFLLGGSLIYRSVRSRPDFEPLLKRLRSWAPMLAAGALMLALSFPVYLLLDSARGLWRTQLLAGIGWGLTMTAAIGLAVIGFRNRTAATALFLTICSTLVGFGALAAIQRGARHFEIWERYRFTLAEVLRAAPSVNQDTIIVLTNVPKDRDPFGHNMWFDVAVRLAYPHTPVAGIYFYADGTPSPGSNLVLAGRRWSWDHTGYEPAVRGTALENTVVIEYDPGGRGAMMGALPGFICRKTCSERLYKPSQVITDAVSPIAARRYGPL